VADRGARRRIDRFSRHGVPPRASVQDQDSARQDRRERARRPAGSRVRAERHRHRKGAGAAQIVSVRDSPRAIQDADEGGRYSAPVHAGDVLQAGDQRTARSQGLDLTRATNRRMSDHFAAFSFVDRITEFAPGAHARGWYAVPRDIAEFPSCLVAEAVGQLAAGVAMDKLGYRGRPVAALATETLFEGSVEPGDLLELDVDIDDCDDEVIAYGGRAKVNGRQVIELRHCLGPMLPVEELDSPDALRERFALLRGRGAAAGGFRGVAPVPLTVDDRVPAKSLHATLMVPEHAAFFGDHFPRRPVFPATLLLDAQMRMAVALAASYTGDASWSPSLMSNVKMRAFITPGEEVDLEARMLSAAGETPRV